MRLIDIFIILFFLTPLNSFAQLNEMPIIGFMGVPESQTSARNFQLMKECGFNVSLNQYSSTKAMVASCRIAEKEGLLILGSCPEMKTRPEEVARQLKSEKGFFGYYLGDEPTAPGIKSIDNLIRRLMQKDNTHVFYFNLLPFENPAWVEGNTKVKTYDEYLRTASATKAQQISFDHYPIKNDGICKTWYQNLEYIRKESIRSKKPFWGFVMSVPHWHYPQPTLSSLRLQVYVNLAYGAQAIQYFTYWTPKANTENFNYRNGPVDASGRQTSTYNLVQTVNKEIKPLTNLLYKAQMVSVFHIGELPLGTTKLKKLPKNILSFKIVSKKGAIVSQFRKDSHSYMLIVNKDYQDNMKVLLKSNDKVCRLTKNMSRENVKNEYTIAPADVLLFRLE